MKTEIGAPYVLMCGEVTNDSILPYHRYLGNSSSFLDNCTYAIIQWL